jgi:hypothetical protein
MDGCERARLGAAGQPITAFQALATFPQGQEPLRPAETIAVRGSHP